MIQFLSWENASDPKKERLTKDVRYQEFNEVTLDRFCVHANTVKGYFIVSPTAPREGVFLRQQIVETIIAALASPSQSRLCRASSPRGRAKGRSRARAINDHFLRKPQREVFPKPGP